MSRIGTFKKGFALALSNELIYRVNFIIGRVREFIVFAALLYLYTSIPNGVGPYSKDELIAYTLVSALISAPLFVYGMHAMAEEINVGDVTNYLLRPIGYFRYWTGRVLATRALAFFGGLIQLLLLLAVFRNLDIFRLLHAAAFMKAGLLFFGSIALIQVIDFLGAILSFWTPRGHGPRWLVTIAVAFLSGSYLPIDLWPEPVRTAVLMTPFPSLIYLPVKALLDNPSWDMVLAAARIQWTWALGISAVVAFIWRRGLRRYVAYGG